MKEINNYYQGYNESKNKLHFLKYNILNNYGYTLKQAQEYYNEEKIIKKE